MSRYDNFHMRCMRDIGRWGWSFWLWSVDLQSQSRHELLPVEFNAEPTPDIAVPKPFVTIPEDQMQALFDDLWNGGMRPSKRLQEVIPMKHLEGEIQWNRDVIDRLLKKAKM